MSGTSKYDKIRHSYCADVHDTDVFPVKTEDSLMFTAGDAVNSWAKTEVGAASEAGTGTLLTDSIIDFIAIGARVGQTISNTTDGSSATITAVTTNTITSEALTGGVDNTWENADAWSIAVTNGWKELLDSDDNKLTTAFSSKGHVTSIDIDKVEVANKTYILEIGVGDETVDATTRVAILRFISNVAATNFQTPKHYRIRADCIQSTDKIYYRMKCETASQDMYGSMRYYLH